MESLMEKALNKQEKTILNNSELRPLIFQRADPYIVKHDGRYYFTASVPEYDRIELRSSTTIRGLRDANPKVIWKKHEKGLQSEHIWAPEMHLIDGVWYMYYAASDKDNKWELRPYLLKCEGKDPMTDTWTEMGAIKALKGDDAFTDFSLDATVFKHNGKNYLIWAEKVGHQFGISNLYIALLAEPDRLGSKRVLIASPKLKWEVIDFSVNEGPFVIKSGGRVYVTFSASATGAMYCMGLLFMDENDDPLDPASWIKKQEPIFSTMPDLKIFGPGHNCFTEDEKGNTLCVFHARPYKEIVGDPLYDPNRHTFVMKTEFDKNGEPVFIPSNILED